MYNGSRKENFGFLLFQEEKEGSYQIPDGDEKNQTVHDDSYGPEEVKKNEKETDEMRDDDEIQAYIDQCASLGVDPVYEFIVTLSDPSTFKTCVLSQRKYPLHDMDVKCLARALYSNRDITHIDFSGNRITDMGFQYLAEAISENEYISHLILGSNRAGDEGCQVLCKALASNRFSRITYLDLQNNNIGNNGLSPLSDVLRMGTLQTLILQKNRIDDDGVRALCESAIIENNSLTVLNLQSNAISDAGALAIAEVLRHQNSNIMDLDLGINAISSNGGIALAESLKGNRTITRLSLRSNHILDAGANSFAQLLSSGEGTCVLQELYLGFNGISLEMAVHFSEMLKMNKTLKIFDMQGIILDSAKSVQLADCLKDNQNLKRLMIDLDTSNESVQKIFQGVHDNYSFAGVVIGSNEIIYSAERGDQSNQKVEVDNDGIGAKTFENATQGSPPEKAVKLVEEKERDETLKLPQMEKVSSQNLVDMDIESELVRIISEKDKCLKDATFLLQEQKDQLLDVNNRITRLERQIGEMNARESGNEQRILTKSEMSSLLSDNIMTRDFALEQVKIRFDLKLSAACKDLEDRLITRINEMDLSHSQTAAEMKKDYDERIEKQMEIIGKMKEEQNWVEEEGIRLRVEQEAAMVDQLQSLKQEVVQKSQALDNKLLEFTHKFKSNDEPLMDKSMQRLLYIDKRVERLSMRMSHLEKSMSNENDNHGIEYEEPTRQKNDRDTDTYQEGPNDPNTLLQMNSSSMSSKHGDNMLDYHLDKSYSRTQGSLNNINMIRSPSQIRKARSNTSFSRVRFKNPDITTMKGNSTDSTLEKRMATLNHRVTVLEDEFYNQDDHGRSLIALQDILRNAVSF